MKLNKLKLKGIILNDIEQGRELKQIFSDLSIKNHTLFEFDEIGTFYGISEELSIEAHNTQVISKEFEIISLDDLKLLLMDDPMPKYGDSIFVSDVEDGEYQERTFVGFDKFDGVITFRSSIAGEDIPNGTYEGGVFTIPVSNWNYWKTYSSDFTMSNDDENEITIESLLKLREDNFKYFTREESLRAVREDIWNLAYVKYQTTEICLEAVKYNGYALQYVINQTEEICMEAYKENPYSIVFIRDTLEDYRKRRLNLIKNII